KPFFAITSIAASRIRWYFSEERPASSSVRATEPPFRTSLEAGRRLSASFVRVAFFLALRIASPQCCLKGHCKTLTPILQLQSKVQQHQTFSASLSLPSLDATSTITLFGLLENN